MKGGIWLDSQKGDCMKRKVSASIAFCLLLTSAFPLSGEVFAKEEVSDNTVTIYLYRENELPVRRAVGWYEQFRQDAAGTPLEAAYPDISWNLVDKSYLSEGAFQSLLWEELAAGGGPDILLTGDGGFDDSQALLASGYLYDLSGYESLYMRSGDLEAETYLPGALEAGQQGGIQYLLPLTAEFPLLFGRTEALDAAGLEGAWTDFGAFAEDLYQAQDRSGLASFAEPSTLAWLEDYGGVDEENLEDAAFDNLISLAAEGGASYFQPQRAFQDGQCLLSGCGKGDFQQMLQNLLRMESSEFSFFLVPDRDGQVSVQITQAAGVNKNSRNPEAALAALAGIQEGYGYLATGTEDLSARISNMADWDGMSTSAGTVYDFFFDYDFLVHTDTSYLQNELLDWLLEEFESSAKGVVFKDPTSASPQMERLDEGVEKEVVTVLYNGSGTGIESPLTQWLNDAADSFQSEDIYVQPIPDRTDDFILASNFVSISRVPESAADLLITRTDRLYLEGRFSPDSQTLSELLEEHEDALDALYAVPYDEVYWEGERAGLPIGTKSFGIWYNRTLLDELGFHAEDLEDGLESWTGLVRAVSEAGQDAGIQQPILACLGAKIEILGITSCLTEDTLFALDPEEGWQVSQEAWAEAVTGLYSLRKDCGIASVEKSEALDSLLEGSAVMALGASDLDLPLRQWDTGQESPLGYVQLSPYVTQYAAFLSEHAENPEAAFAFLLEALQSDSYEESIKRIGLEPVTGEEKREVTCLPIYDWDFNLPDFWDSLWQEDADPEELAQNHMPCPWMKE